MSRSTIGAFELFELFPDEEAARKYLEGGASNLRCGRAEDPIQNKRAISASPANNSR
jgi:hypothetical protein